VSLAACPYGHAYDNLKSYNFKSFNLELRISMKGGAQLQGVYGA